MRRLPTGFSGPFSGSLARQVRLLLVLSAALAGFFLLLDLLINVVSTAPQDILAVNPASEEFIGLPNGVALLEFAILSVFIALALTVLISTLGWPITRASIRPSLSLALGTLAAAALVGTGAFLALSGVIGREVSYAQHEVKGSLLEAGRLALLASFFLSLAMAGMFSRKLLAAVLAAWLIAGLAFGLLDTKPLDGLELFERTTKLERPAAFTSVVERYMRTSEGLEATAPLAPGESVSQSEKPGTAERDVIPDLDLSRNATAAQGHLPDPKPVFRVTGAANTRYLRTATGDVYENGEWRQLEIRGFPVGPGVVIDDAAVIYIHSVEAGNAAGVPSSGVNTRLLALPTTAPNATPTDHISITPAGESGAIHAGVVPVTRYPESISATGTYDPFSGTLTLAEPVSQYDWLSSSPGFAPAILTEAAPASGDTYLQLPEDLPERVRQMADEFSVSESPYLNANRIMIFLQEEMTYGFAEQGAEPELPPEGKDPVDWFLFEKRIGSSGNFSSAFVVLARAAGIPARVVSGWVIEETEAPQVVLADQVHQWAEIALEGVGWVTVDPSARVSEGQETEPSLVSAVRDLTTSPDPKVREEAAATLGELGDPEALPALVESLETDSAIEVRESALVSLQRLGLEELVWLLLNHDDPRIRAAAARGLNALRDARALDPLLQALSSDDDPGVREEAARALASVGKDRAEEGLLLAATVDESASVRAAAVETLGKLRTDWTASQLVSILQSDSSWRVREMAAWALGEIREPVALRPLLQTRSEDEDSIVKSAAEDSLEKWRSMDLISVLQESGEAAERAAAAQILGEREFIGAIPALSGAINDPSETVREAALEALSAIGAITWLENGIGLLTREPGDIALIPGVSATWAASVDRSPVFEVKGASNSNLLRSAVGDTYSDGRWLPSERPILAGGFSDTLSLPADVQTSLSASTVHRDHISITHAVPSRRFLAGSVPISLRLASVSVPGAYLPNSAIYVINSSTSGYSWVSNIHDFSESELSAASKWTATGGESYLELSGQTWLGRVRDLAMRITSGHPTPYAQARAIESYLKSEYTYRLADPGVETEPPAGTDPIDWFLFESREGTSGNFSSAFVVLARSAGIPARVVAGWAIDPRVDEQTVYSDQAHQWAEVAFDGLGWVTFDPTPGGAPSRAIIEPLTEGDLDAIKRALEAVEGGSASSLSESDLAAIASGLDALSGWGGGSLSGGDFQTMARALDSLGDDGTGTLTDGDLEALGSLFGKTIASSLSDLDPEALGEALEVLEQAGAEVTRLENGGSIVSQKGYTEWVPGTTTRQSPGLLHIPVFNVSGAANTSYLRTTVGDVYEQDQWRELDPVTIPYTAGDNVAQTVWPYYANRVGEFASLAEQRLETQSLLGFRDDPGNARYDRIRINPAGSETHLPSGRMLSSLHLLSTDLNGSVHPFSSAFSTGLLVQSYSWTSEIPSYPSWRYAAAGPATDPTYTQLPSDLPDRLRTLALDITAGHSTTYAKAKALEQYLSTNYTYEFADPSGADIPPPDRDPMDWFLFDHREGTCGVFSSAFVVLARSIGIPARVVSGWMISPTGETQTVYSDQAHQWAEVAFQGLGWITFEPTASGGAPSRVGGNGNGDSKDSIAVEAPPPPKDTLTTITQWPYEVRRQTPFTVGGAVTTLDGRNVSGLDVEIYVNETKEHGGTKIGSATTSQYGYQAEVTIPEDLELGAYQLLARAVSNDSYNESWSDPDITVFSGSGLELTGPSEITIDAEALFEGKLSEDTGRVVAGRELKVTIDGNAAPPVVTNSAGHFAFSRTFSSAGPHWVEVELEEEAFLLYNTARLNFQVTLPTETVLHAPAFVEVSSEFQVTGDLRDARGKPLAGEYVYVQVGEGLERTVVTNSSGVFEFADTVYEAGEFTVTAEFQGNGPVLSSNGTARLASQHHVVLTIDGPGRIEQDDGATFVGMLESDTFSPTGELELIIENSLGQESTLVTTDEDGRFEYNHEAFPNTGPHSLTGSFSGSEYVGSSTAGIAFHVSAPTLLTLDGPKAVKDGDSFEVTGTLLQRNGRAVPGAEVNVTGTDALTLVTDDNGRFHWETVAAFDTSLAGDATESEFSLEVNFAGTDHLGPSSAGLDVVVGIPGIVVEALEPVARGDEASLRGTVLIGSRPAPDIPVTIDQEASVKSNMIGAFAYDFPVSPDTPLGPGEVEVSAASLGASVSVPIVVKSVSSLAFTQVDDPEARDTTVLQATLLDDTGAGIPQATLRSSQGEEAITDTLGAALFEIDTPEPEELAVVTLTFTFDGDGRHLPLSETFFLSIQPAPAGFNWLLWAGIPGLVALLAAAVLAGRRLRAVTVPQLIRRREVVAEPSHVSPTAAEDQRPEGGDETEAARETRMEVVFVKDAQDLPDVWEPGEEVSAVIRLTGWDEQPIAGADVSVSIEGVEYDSQQTTDDQGVCALSWTASGPGEYRLLTAYEGDAANRPSSASRNFRIVDFREEIVRLYNVFLAWARRGTASIQEQSTPREIELMLVSEGLPVDQKSLDELISRFEEADYSEHPIARRHYEAMHRAWRTVVGD